MLIEVAKREYLSANPGRQRTPRGFAKGLELHLAAIEEGSAVLSLVLTGLSLLPHTESAYIASARDKIAAAIGSVEKGKQPDLAPELLRYFDRFGRSLQEGESIAFSLSDGETTNLTPELRQKLLRASQAEEWTEEATLKGRISAVDQADGTFELQLRDGTKLKAPLDEQHRQTILDVFTRYRSKGIAAVQGIIKRDRSGRSKSFESIEHINALDPLDVTSRLEELALLESGWLDGKGGLALDPAALKRLSEAFDQFFAVELPLPHLYPTAEGGVQAEWSSGEWEVSLEIQLPSLKAAYQALHLRSGECEEREFDLAADDWMKLNDALRVLRAPESA
jgi:hypothetical protein